MVAFGLQTSDPVELLGDIALQDPIAATVLVAGIAIMAFSMGFVGYLTAGAVLDGILRPFG
jgi:hypothetical protein